MAFTVYGLQTAAGGPYSASGDTTAITGGNPAVGANLYGFVTGEGVCKFFASSNGAQPYGAVNLPQFVTPNTVPIGAVQIGTSAIWAVQSSYGFGFNTSTQVGQLYFAVQAQAGSPDVGSPQEFLVDPYTVFLVAAANFQLP